MHYEYRTVHQHTSTWSTKSILNVYFYWNDVLHRTKMHHIYTQLNLITKWKNYSLTVTLTLFSAVFARGHSQDPWWHAKTCCIVQIPAAYTSQLHPSLELSGHVWSAGNVSQLSSSAHSSTSVSVYRLKTISRACHFIYMIGSYLNLPSVLWCYWFGVRKGIRPVKIWLMRCWRGYLLERSANSLHMVQLMALPSHHVCFSKIKNGLSFWYRLTWIVPDKGS